MNQLVFSESLFAYMKRGLFAESSVESCAILLMNRASSDGTVRFLVREVVLAPPEAYVHRTERLAELKSTFVAEMVQRACAHGFSVCFVHTHVSSHAIARFSDTDNSGERKLLPFVEQRTGTCDHLALVVSERGMAARMLGTEESVIVSSVGANIQKIGLADDDVSLKRFDRQIRAFGKPGQRVISSQRVCIVGLGGTGSIVAQSLAYLGVNQFLLVDHDMVSETNLNRLVGATYEDIGRYKVDVVARHIKKIHPSATVNVVVGDITNLKVSHHLLNADLIFGCTDSHGSRAVLNQFAYQYLTPVIDMGVSLVAQDQEVTRITGRVQMLSPDLGCLVCANLLNYDQVRWDFMSEKELAADPYFIGQGDPSPAVISVNSTVASLAVTMFLSVVAGIPSEARFQIYDGIKGAVRVAKVTPIGGCVVCSSSGVLGKGDRTSLPGRVDHT